MRKQKIFFNAKKIVAVSMLGLGLSTFAVSIPSTLLTVDAEIVKTSDIQVKTGKAGYSVWASPIYSYLAECDNGKLMRVQWNGTTTVVEYYDKDFNLVQYKELEAELPIFGGFYEGSDAYYIVTGQNNAEQSADVECFRITKYDKSWKRIASTGLANCNTTVPFDAGSLRMTEDSGYLFIRTSHEMYKTKDGYNHQANVTIQVDESKMEITDKFTGIMNKDYGYISHSFNQFIKTENNHIIAVDHGDAYPRSIALIEYPSDFTGGKFVSNLSWKDSCKVTNLFTMSGGTGNNYTGVSVGGFEITDKAYIVTANSIDQEKFSNDIRNVYVLGKNKTDGSTISNKITDYTDVSASTPYLVKIENNKYMVIWEVAKEGKVYYTYIDGAGTQTSDIKSINGKLSDCQPIVYNGTVVWYYSDGNDKNVTFYGINKDGSELKQELSVTQTVKNSNNTITITANGTGGSGELTYKFIMYNADTKEWKKLQDFSKSNEYTGNINDYGELHFYTDVKDANGEVVRSEVSRLTIKDNNPLKINAAQKDNGNTVTFTANGSGGSGKYTYKFIVYNKTTNSWAKLQDFSDKNTFTWTKGNEGNRYFYVDVKDNSTGRVVRSEALNVKINKEDKPTSTLTVSTAKVNVGSKVTLTAKATAGSGKYTYKFLIYNPTTKQWAKLQDFSDKSTFTWTAGSVGARQFYVDVKDSNGYVTRSKVVNVEVENIQPATKLSVKASASTTANKVGQNVTFTATGNGGTGGYTYKFLVYNKTTKQWAKIQDFSAASKLTWKAGSVGEREFYIDVKDKNGNVVRSSVMNVKTTK